MAVALAIAGPALAAGALDLEGSGMPPVSAMGEHYVPSPVDVGWQVWVGFAAGVIPFIIGAYEFGKRILIQRRCQTCGGNGLVTRGQAGRQVKCPTCGGFFPWVSWRLFLTSTAAPGNGGPLRAPKGQTSVFYSVPPASGQRSSATPGQETSSEPVVKASPVTAGSDAGASLEGGTEAPAAPSPPGGASSSSAGFSTTSSRTQRPPHLAARADVTAAKRDVSASSSSRPVTGPTQGDAGDSDDDLDPLAVTKKERLEQERREQARQQQLQQQQSGARGGFIRQQPSSDSWGPPGRPALDVDLTDLAVVLDMSLRPSPIGSQSQAQERGRPPQAITAAPPQSSGGSSSTSIASSVEPDQTAGAAIDDDDLPEDLMQGDGGRVSISSSGGSSAVPASGAASDGRSEVASDSSKSGGWLNFSWLWGSGDKDESAPASIDDASKQEGDTMAGTPEVGQQGATAEAEAPSPDGGSVTWGGFDSGASTGSSSSWGGYDAGASVSWGGFDSGGGGDSGGGDGGGGGDD